MTKREIELEAKHAVNAALELFQRKWLLRVVWELHQGPKTFRALQQACDDLSPTVVNSRLGDLREAGLVELLPGRGSALTARRGLLAVDALGRALAARPASVTAVAKRTADRLYPGITAHRQ